MAQPDNSAGARPVRANGSVDANARVSSGLWRLDLTLDAETGFTPGQFAMVNLAGPGAFVFSRPFSILEAEGRRLSLLYRIVGRGTTALAALQPGDGMTVLTPLGHPFPERQDDLPALMIAGGVGLPPVAAWLRRYGREGDLAFFGARDGGDVPWNLLPSPWRVAVDASEGLEPGREVTEGLVTAVAGRQLDAAADGPRMVLACGPLPMLRAAQQLALERGWPCWLSLEEHMGCGYGVCKGCVIPVRGAGPDGWRNATCCQEGPVFAAQDICWERHRSELLARGSG
jgi:dihydroorotate dehydrogenase electron transfer subunit